MNDQELDEILNAWKVPPVTGSLRQDVRGRFAASLAREIPSKPWARWLTARSAAAAIASVLALGLFVNQAIPQVQKMDVFFLHVPFTVDSEFLRYADDGSPSVEMYTTSFDRDGDEFRLSSSFPEQPFRTALVQTAEWIGLLAFDISLPFRSGNGKHERARAAFIKNGCAADGQIVRPGEPILGYRTVAMHFDVRDKQRGTVWMAPDLACLGLQFTIEKQWPDGTFHLLQARRTLRINSRQ